MPFPLLWQVVSETAPRGIQSLYAWEPLPPSDAFVALGMLFTTSPETPDVTSIRCIRRSWCRESRQKPQRLWDDRGTHGRAGSLWRVNNMGLVWAVASSDYETAPLGPFYELKDWPFSLWEVAEAEAAEEAETEAEATEAEAEAEVECEGEGAAASAV